MKMTDTLGRTTRALPFEARFEAGHSKGAANECWEWTASKNRDGYGMIMRAGVRMGAHRASYEMSVGPIPEGMHLDHLCRNRSCVNPAHLEPVTFAENIRRGQSMQALNARKTHCIRGHEFTPENTRVMASGRACRACAKLQSLDYKARRRAAKAANVPMEKRTSGTKAGSHAHTLQVMESRGAL